MKITRLYTLLVVLSVILTSCFEDPGTDITWEGGSFVELDAATTSGDGRNYSFTRLNDGTTYAAGIEVLRVSSDASQAVNVSFSINASSTAIEGVHYTVSGTTATIASGEWVGTLPITILADNIEAGETWNIDITLTDADIPLGDRVSASAFVSIICPSDLAGTYSFSSVNLLAAGGAAGSNAGPVTGTGELATTPSSGVYTVTDASFGLFADLYGDSPASGPLMTDVCDLIDFDGSGDQYGDTYSITNLSVSGDGTSITFDWVNTYGDGATTTLTRTDGNTWPSTLNSN